LSGKTSGMQRILKFTKEQSDNMVFVSDLHYGHDRDFLYRPRGFDGVKEHNRWIREQWDEHVDMNTTVFNLGDVCFNDPRGDTFTEISKWGCREHYVLFGNHNSGMNQCYQIALQAWYEEMGVEFTEKLKYEVYPLEFNNVVFCGEDLVIRVGKQEAHMSHFPKRIWDHVGRSSYALNGHSHGNDKERTPSHPNGKSLDVGVENSIKHDDKLFFTFREVVEIMSTKSIEVLDHHDENTN